MIKSKIFILKAESYSRKHLDLFSLQLSSLFLMYCLVSSNIFHCRLLKPCIVFFSLWWMTARSLALESQLISWFLVKDLALNWLIFNLVKFLGSFKYGKIVPSSSQFFIHIWKHLSRRKVLSAIEGTFHMSYRRCLHLWKLQISLYLKPPSHTQDHLVNRSIPHTRYLPPRICFCHESQ